MRHVDFSPLYRSTVVFDRLFHHAGLAWRSPDNGQTYPPLQHPSATATTPTASPWRWPLSPRARSRSRPIATGADDQGRDRPQEQKSEGRVPLPRHCLAFHSSDASSSPTTSR